MILMNYDKAIIVDGKCSPTILSDGKTAQMVCHTICEEVELPTISPHEDLVFVVCFFNSFCTSSIHAMDFTHSHTFLYRNSISQDVGI